MTLAHVGLALILIYLALAALASAATVYCMTRRRQCRVIIPKHLAEAECVCTACGYYGDDAQPRHCYECGCRTEDDRAKCTECRQATMVSTCLKCGPYSSGSDDAYVPIEFVHEQYIQEVIEKTKQKGGA